MNLQQNKKSHNDIIKNVAKRIFKYIGLAPKEIKRCPECWEAGFSTYEYLNVITRQVVYSCYDCIKDLTIETKPQIAVIQLGGSKVEERIKKRLEYLKGEKAKLEELEIKRNGQGFSTTLTNEEWDQLFKINDEIQFLTISDPKPKPEVKAKSYPIKDFLLTHSWLVQYNNKENAEKELTKPEQEKQARIYAKRDRAMRLISFHLESYYNTVIRGDYRFDGKPEIRRGIGGWIEEKIWELLIAIGEPNYPYLKNDPAEYWEEAK